MITTYTQEYMLRLKSIMADQYTVKAKDQKDPSIHRGLRNADGTGVLIGTTSIGSVQGYYMQEGERKPMPGKLYYRGISLEDIVETHKKNNTFGFTEVVFLLLAGRLPNQAELDEFEAMAADGRLAASVYEQLSQYRTAFNQAFKKLNQI